MRVGRSKDLGELYAFTQKQAAKSSPTHNKLPLGKLTPLWKSETFTDLTGRLEDVMGEHCSRTSEN